MDANSAKPVEDGQPSMQNVVGRKRGAKGPAENVDCPVKRTATTDNVSLGSDKPAETTGASGGSNTGLGTGAATKEPSDAAQGYLPMDEAARRDWVDRKCAKYENIWRASEKASGRRMFEKRLDQIERWLSKIHAKADVDGKTSAHCDFCEEIDGLPPHGLVKELVLRSDQTGLGEEYLRDLRLLFPKMRALTIEIEDAWFSHRSDRKERWIVGMNNLCELLESFLHADDTIEQIRFDVLDKPGVAVKSFKGFKREADKFVKVVRLGAKTFSASIQASSQDIFGRRFC